MLDAMDKVKLVDQLCYLGQMLGKGGGVEETSNKIEVVMGKIQ